MISKIIWFTGLSGAGKSTLSNNLSKVLRKKKFKVIKIDGDKFRKKKKYKNKFSKKNIIKNNLQIINYIKKIYTKYDFILIAVISPLLKTRTIAKKMFKNYYYEVYVHCSIRSLKKRDTKGLYKKTDMKIINNLIGYKSNIKYEKSKYQKISINTDIYDLRSCVNRVYKKIL